MWAWPSYTCRELDPGRERGAEATHCSHEVLQSPAEPHGAAEAHLQVLQGGAEGSWSPGEAPFRGPRLLGPSPALLASARPPEASSALLPTGERRGGGLPPSSLSSLSAHTCAHAPSPRLCMPRVPTGRHHQRVQSGPTHSHPCLIVPPGLPPLRVSFRKMQTVPVTGCLLYGRSRF